MQQDIDTTTRRETIVGVFEDRARAEEAVTALHEAGYDESRIGFAGPHADTPMGDDHPHTEGALAGAAGGALTGAAVGGVLGAVAAALIPGVGPIIAGGLLAGIVAGAPTGAAIGGLAGGLRGAGIPEHEAGYYEDQVRGGRFLVVVKGAENQTDAERIITNYGGRTEGPISDAVTRTTGTMPVDPTVTTTEPRVIEDTTDTTRF